MLYSEVVKQGVVDSDTPPGFSAKPSPIKQATKKPQPKKKVVEEPVLDVDEVKMWADQESDSSDEIDYVNFEAVSESDEQEPTPTGKRYVKKGTAPTETTTTATKSKSSKLSQRRIEFQNIKNLILNAYGDRLAVLNGVAKEMNDELKSEIRTKDRDLHNKIKKINQPPKAQKSVWKGGERNQDTPVEPGKKKFNENNNNNNNNNKDGAKKGKNQKGKGGNNKKKDEKKGSSKVHVTTVDEDGFVLKQVLTSEQAELVKKGQAIPVQEVETKEAVVVDEKKKKPAINSASYSQNNPFGAVLLAGAFESVEAEIAKKQKKKVESSSSNKAKQRKAGQQQQKAIQKLAEETAQLGAQNKKKKTGNNKAQPNNQKKPVVPQQTKVQQKKGPQVKQQQQKQEQAKKKEKKVQERNAQNEAKAKRDAQIKKQKDAEAIRLQNEEKRIAANLRNIEKEKKLLRLAKKNQSKDQEWYENEYVQPAALVGACIIVLGVVYSFVFQV